MDRARTWTARAARHDAVSVRLAALPDAELAALLAESPGAVGIGGTTGQVTVGGVPVFVKSVPLTDLERRPAHVGSTANLFGLPMFYQYGIGSAGFGAWREVAAHTMTTRWVLDRRCHGFPLLYHWRVLPRPEQPVDHAEVDRWTAHWENSAAVRTRLEAIGAASAVVVLFLEHIPDTVDSWLTARTAAGESAAGAAYTMVDRDLRAVTTFLESRGLVHFDAHFRNLLTDGHRVYFADFGLALHTRFDLDAADSAFLRRHRGYDRCYTATHLTQWLMCTLLRIPWGDGLGHLRRCTENGEPVGIPPSAARIVARYTPVALVMGDFNRALEHVDKRTPYPAEELLGALR